MASRQFHVINSKARDATVGVETCKIEDLPHMGLPGKEVQFRRYLSATKDKLHDGLLGELGDDYSQALIEGDPEVDMEQVGRRVSKLNTVFLAHDGALLHASPKVIELIIDPDGSERERREPIDIEANVNDELPVRWTGRKMSKADAARRFAFRRTLQLRHVDGLSYDFLHAMAKELHDEGQVVLLGGGPKGKEPLIFSTNASPYRGFLEGRVDGERYQLLLHLSNLELKSPAKEG